MIALTQLNCNWGFYIHHYTKLFSLVKRGKEHDIKTYAFYAVSMWNTTFVRLRLVGGWKSGGIEKI